MKIGVFGLWHLGCVFCAAWSKLGFQVLGFDYSKELVSNLNEDQPPIFEPGLKEALQDKRHDQALEFTNDITRLSECAYIFLAYDTPVLDNDESDLTLLEKAIGDLENVLKDDAVVIVSSQLPAGTSRRFRDQLQKKVPSSELVYSPENLRLGQAIDCYLNPGRIIVGAETENAKSKAAKLFGKIDAEIISMNLSSAEMVKHAINSFLANSIVFADQLSDLCEASGASILDVTKGMRTDERIGARAYLQPGIGFSGGTLGRDLQVLAKLNTHSEHKSFLFESLLKFNSDRKNVIINKISSLLGDNVSGKTISILGLTYKPGTSTLRRSLPVEIVNLLAEMGSKLKVYDPKADYNELEGTQKFNICRSVDEAIEGSDLIVLLTEWEDFKEYDWSKGAMLVKDNKFLDAKNFLYDLDMSQKGYQYSGLGL